ncbi:uncharacterized protein FFFS_15910 [Fusarium fujikuroi]|nr:uncharacterized protein FFFS_15910 [Fusarium fujikuroi]
MPRSRLGFHTLWSTASVADVSHGFWSIPIQPSDREKTGILALNGLYYYSNTLMGLNGSSATYARFGDLVFGHLFIEDGSELLGRAELIQRIKQAFFECSATAKKSGKPSVLRRETKRDMPEWNSGAAAALESISTDDSRNGTGGVLLQLDSIPAGEDIDEKNFKRKNYHVDLGRFSDAEHRYTMPEKEMLAVVRRLSESDWMINHSSHPDCFISAALSGKEWIEYSQSTIAGLTYSCDPCALSLRGDRNVTLPIYLLTYPVQSASAPNAPDELV